jgi:phage terminase large subunit GpA-like protein
VTVAAPVWEDYERAAWRPPPTLTIDQWAEQTVVLPRSVSSEPGPLCLDRTPYLREVLQSVTDPDVEEITLCFSTQVGKTLAAILSVLYFVDQDPWPALHVMPREDDAVSINTDRYQRIVQESPKLARHLTGAAHDMTREAIRLNGAVVTFAGANSPAALASRAIGVLVLDETDKYPAFSGKEADPIALARERTRTFIHRKILKTSTPTTERGYIWREYQESDRRTYHVPCPRCGVFQRLVLGTKDPESPGVKWPADVRDPERLLDEHAAWYECASCKGRIVDRDKALMLRKGVWVPEGCTVVDGHVEGKQPPRRRMGYHLSALYSPWLTWSHIAAEKLRCGLAYSKVMNFTNSWLAEIMEDKVEEVTAAHVRARVGGYMIGTVPPEAHLLTAGVDVQLDHLWYVLQAWGAFGESWVVRAGRLESWEALNEVLFHSRYTAGPDPIAVRCALIDMGYRTDEVFAFCMRTGCQAVKGAAAPSRPFTVSKHLHATGEVSPLVVIDTGYYKAKLHRLIRTRDGDPGAWHLPGVVNDLGETVGGVDEEFYAHVISEQRVREQDKKTGRVHYPWKRIPAGAANHELDALVYSLAAADILNVEHSLTAPPVRGIEANAALSEPKPVQSAPNRPRFQQIRTRFFT